MAYAGWLDRLKQTHWSNKLLLGIVLGSSLGFAGIGLWIATLPEAPTGVQVLPQYASLKKQQTRIPLNLPEPAAGQSKITLPLTLPEPKKQPAASAAPGPTNNAAQTAQPQAQKPRTLLSDLTEEAAGLKLPVIAKDKTTSFEAYKARFTLEEDDERARIALIVTGVGLNTARSEKALNALPSTMSIAISPYGRTPQRWADLGLDQERDILIMVPMEPNSFPTVDPGPDTLMRDAPAIQTLQRFHTVLSKAQGYIGIINDTGSRFTANQLSVAPLLDDIAARGLMVVDARASAYSVLAPQAKKRGIPVAVNTRFIDSSLAPNDIDRQLRDLERTASTVGSAVGILRDFPITLERVLAWEKALNKEEFVLTPISAVANRQPIR